MAVLTVWSRWPWPSLDHSRLAALTPRSQTGSPRRLRIFVPTTLSGSGALTSPFDGDVTQPVISPSATGRANRNIFLTAGINSRRSFQKFVQRGNQRIRPNLITALVRVQQVGKHRAWQRAVRREKFFTDVEELDLAAREPGNSQVHGLDLFADRIVFFATRKNAEQD